MTPQTKLSTRLKFVSDLIDLRHPLWDVCCDHGYLGEWALRSQCPEVHFVDAVPSIIHKLQNRLAPHLNKVQGKAHFYAQPGEDVVQNLVGTLVVLGVGPHIILRILEKAPRSGNTFILGPQRNPEKVEIWLKSHGIAYEIFQVQEGERERVIIKAQA